MRTNKFHPRISAFLRLLAVCVVFAALRSPAQTLDWAARTGGPGEDVAKSMVVDQQGNVLVTGYFQNALDLDPGPGSIPTTSAGGFDAFVQKFDADGNLLWARHWGSPGVDYPVCVSADLQGNVYVAGTFTETVDFDPGPDTAFKSTAGVLRYDMFVSKFSASGDFLWVQQITGSGVEQPRALEVGVFGNIYLLGYFTQMIDADPGPGQQMFTSSGVANIILEKLNSDGELQWAQVTGSAGTDVGFAMTLDITENVYFTGSFDGQMDFDPGPGALLLTSAGDWDIFVTKRSSQGALQWAVRMGGVDMFESGYDIAVDDDGNVITVGSFQGVVDFDPGPGNVSLAPVGIDDIFVQKLNPAGELIWVERIGGSGADFANSVAVRSDGGVDVSGYFSNTVDFDPDPAGTFELTVPASNNVQQAYLCRLRADGSFGRAVQFGGCTAVINHSIALDGDDRVFVAGHLENQVDLDPGAPIASFTSAGSYDAFVLRLNDATIGFDESPVASTLQVYPNPATNAITVELTSSEVGNNYQLLDAAGRLVQQGRFASMRNTIDVSALSPGLYQLRSGRQGGGVRVVVGMP
jgi:Secretion system C-terminal sorting domain